MSHILYFHSVKDWIFDGMPFNSYVFGNCLEGMIAMPEKFVDLSIADPPYGIKIDGQNFSTGSHGGRKIHEFRGWDRAIPSQEYFDRLFKVSKNQIIWGGNYFTKYLPPSKGWIFWDKGQRICNSDGELAFSSFDRALRVVEYNRVELLIENTIHPTQKPQKLYRYLLANYAEFGQTILDTHCGSANSLIACMQMGFSFLGFEIDEYYYRVSVDRIEKARECLKQGDMFTLKELNNKSNIETMELFDESLSFGKQRD